MDNRAADASNLVLREEKINLRHYWHVTLERRWLVVSAFCSIFVLCLIYLFNAQRIYQATARMQIDRESENVLNIKEVFAMDSREQDYLQTQYKNLQSRSIIQSVIAKLKLDKVPRYAKSADVVRAVAQDIAIVPIRLSRLVDVKVENRDRPRRAPPPTSLRKRSYNKIPTRR